MNTNTEYSTTRDLEIERSFVDHKSYFEVYQCRSDPDQRYCRLKCSNNGSTSKASSDTRSGASSIVELEDFFRGVKKRRHSFLKEIV